MMRPSNDLPVVYLCRDAIDFRKGINGLSILVEDALCLDPFSQQLFVFCNRHRNQIKMGLSGFPNEFFEKILLLKNYPNTPGLSPA